MIDILFPIIMLPWHK